MNKQRNPFYYNPFQTKIMGTKLRVLNLITILHFVFVMHLIKNTALEIMFANIRV